jgi:hypothetical protein
MKSTRKFDELVRETLHDLRHSPEGAAGGFFPSQVQYQQADEAIIYCEWRYIKNIKLVVKLLHNVDEMYFVAWDTRHAMPFIDLFRSFYVPHDQRTAITTALHNININLDQQPEYPWEMWLDDVQYGVFKALDFYDRIGEIHYIPLADRYQALSDFSNTHVFRHSAFDFAKNTKDWELNWQGSFSRFSTLGSLMDDFFANHMVDPFGVFSAFDVNETSPDSEIVWLWDRLVNVWNILPETRISMLVPGTTSADDARINAWAKLSGQMPPQPRLKPYVDMLGAVPALDRNLNKAPKAKAVTSGNIKVSIHPDSIEGASLRPDNDEWTDAFRQQVVDNGGPDNISAYLSSVQDLAGVIPVNKLKELEQGYDVTVLMDPWNVGQFYGYDAVKVAEMGIKEFWRRESRRGQP